MNCWTVKRRKADFIEGRVREAERTRIARHLTDCRTCSDEFEQLRAMRSTLERLPQVKSPAHLRTALRVSASRERQAILSNRGSRLRRFWDYWLFRLDELMRPITLPATGGLLSSIILFGALGLTISSSTRVANYEVPVIYEDPTGANLIPLQLSSSVVLTLSLDGKGRITDYTAHDDQASFIGNPTRLQYNNISLPDFPSVLALAQPVTRGISISVTPLVFRR